MLRDVNGIKLNVVEEGDGHPLLFLHGLGGSWRDWEPQLDTLSDRYRCIAIDHRGHGRSERTGGSFSIELFARDAAAVLGALGIDHAYVCGLSMGGMIAQALSLDHPHLVDAVVLADTAARTDPAMGQMMAAAAEMVRSQGLEQTVAMYEPLTWSEATRTERPKVVRDFRRDFGGNDPECFAKSMAAIAAMDHVPRLSGLKPPALVVWGEHDGLTPREHTDVLVEAIGGAELVQIDGAAHMTNVEDPRAFNEAITAFFDRHHCTR
jgi:3-oxoadipate enol-lactonase